MIDISDHRSVATKSPRMGRLGALPVRGEISLARKRADIHELRRSSTVDYKVAWGRSILVQCSLEKRLTVRLPSPSSLQVSRQPAGCASTGSSLCGLASPATLLGRMDPLGVSASRGAVHSSRRRDEMEPPGGWSTPDPPKTGHAPRRRAWVVICIWDPLVSWGRWLTVPAYLP